MGPREHDEECFYAIMMGWVVDNVALLKTLFIGLGKSFLGWHDHTEH